MSTSRVTRQIGHICRIYKNSNDKVIAVDDIEIVGNCMRISDVKFHISVDKIAVNRTLLHLGVGNRVVDTINMIGNYSSVTDDIGNYLVCTWEAASQNENTVEISLEPYVSVIGDTV